MSGSLSTGLDQTRGSLSLINSNIMSSDWHNYLHWSKGLQVQTYVPKSLPFQFQSEYLLVFFQMTSTLSRAASTPSTGWSSTCPGTRRRRRSRWTSSAPAPSPGLGSSSGNCLRSRTNQNLERFWYLDFFNISLSFIGMTLINLHPAPSQWMIII